ncbi:MAG TPA: glutamine--fructose-6-phosphate transaminase (isomerizing) [Candidatus Thermoplasmatota archaeon]|nr:glutamine--fructose-6-phosphate transaminase (isomerizing) [Candidatus Thermoplasmatota archaeon]
MCGIFAITTKGQAAAPLLARGLETLEYRGYDSAGIATFDADGRLHVRKAVGPVSDVAPKAVGLPGIVGLSHTRWATHGGVTDANAHPHPDCAERVAIVHNGILDNHDSLRAELRGRGHRFRSETDSEVVAHLIEENLAAGLAFEDAFVAAVRRLEGQYALAAVAAARPGVIAAARSGAPLAIGLGTDATYLASDALPFIGFTDRVIFLEDDEIAFLDPAGATVRNGEGPVAREPTRVAMDASQATKGSFPHFTLKEIHEIPDAMRAALAATTDDQLRDAALEILRAKDIVITAAGSSRYASLIGRSLLANLAETYAEVVLAAEFEPLARALSRGALVIAVSQSGETLDVIEGVRAAKAQGARVLALVNVPGSSLARMADVVLPLAAGPEIGVAATKSFANQVVAFSLLAHACANRIGEAREGIEAAARAVADLVASERVAIQRTARELAVKRDVYLVARGVHFPVASEGALKIKELAYIHAEGMPAGELKHGTLALIERGVPVIALTGTGDNRKHLLATVAEVRARGATVIGVAEENAPGFDTWIRLSAVEERFQPLVEAAALQLLAYEIAVARGHNPDRPRNLAKSVTVK